MLHSFVDNGMVKSLLHICQMQLQISRLLDCEQMFV